MKYLNDLICKYKYFMRKYERRGFIIALKKYYRGRQLVGVQIGVAQGRDTYNLLRRIPNISKLYLIDPYELSEKTDVKNRDFENQFLHMKNTLYKDYKDILEIIKSPSDEGLKKINEKVDFVYIDGNHMQEWIEKDIRNAYDIVKKYSIICGHDADKKMVMDIVKNNSNGNDYYRILNDWVIEVNYIGVE
jgi:hypothetical protein